MLDSTNVSSLAARTIEHRFAIIIKEMPMQHYSKFQNTALLTLRLIIAVIFLYAAYAKLGFWSDVDQGVSLLMTNLVKFLSIVEPLSAAAITVGFLTRWAATGLAIIMVGAIYVTQFVYQIGFVTERGAGWNFPLMVLAGCFILMTFGAGRWSVDARRGKRSK